MFDQVLSQLALVATIVKKVVDLVKPLYQNLPYQASIDEVLALLLSVGLAIAWQINLLQAAGLVLNPYVGEVATGIVSALGASVLNEVIALLKLLKPQAE